MSATVIDRSVLTAGLTQLGLTSNLDVLKGFESYAELLLKWNKVYNLTAIRNPEEVLTHHLLDSATLVPALQRFVPGVDTVLDVGCGGGLPSVPLALLLPHVSAFVNQVAIELGLKNLTARHARVEKMVGTWKAITSRAFASLADFTHLTMHLLASDGRWLAMKGVVPEDEIAALPSNVKVLAIEKLVVPGLEEERHLIVLGKE